MRNGRWLRAAALALAGAAMAAPAARAHDGVRVVVRNPGPAFSFGHSRECVWRPARWEERVERVVVREGYWRILTTPAAFELRFDLRAWRLVRVCVRPERIERVWVPPVVEERRTRVLVPGSWDCRGRCDC